MEDTLHDQARKIDTGGGPYHEQGAPVTGSAVASVTVNVADLDRRMRLLSEELQARSDDAHARILNEQFMILWGAVAETLKQNAGIQRDLQALERTVGRMVEAVYGNGRVGLLRDVDRVGRVVAALLGSAILQWVALAGLLAFLLALARHVGL